jgi:hypothetical protein
MDPFNASLAGMAMQRKGGEKRTKETVIPVADWA